METDIGIITRWIQWTISWKILWRDRFMIQSRKNLNSCTSRAEKSKLVRILEIRILTTQHSILIYSRQGGCERTHNNIKSIVKFDVRKVRNDSKRLYVLANFVIYQILLLGHLQNKIVPVQQLAQYF